MLYQLSYGHQNEGGSLLPQNLRGVINLSTKNLGATSLRREPA